MYMGILYCFILCYLNHNAHKRLKVHQDLTIFPQTPMQFLQTFTTLSMSMSSTSLHIIPLPCRRFRDEDYASQIPDSQNVDVCSKRSTTRWVLSWWTSESIELPSESKEGSAGGEIFRF